MLREWPKNQDVLAPASAEVHGRRLLDKAYSLACIKAQGTTSMSLGKQRVGRLPASL